MNIQETVNQVPDSVKVAIATSSAALTFFGISVEEWMYILSGVVSLLFIIEKAFSWFHKYKEYKKNKNVSCK